MRALLWRGIALALAGCCSWLLWHWPQTVEPEPVEFLLENDCKNSLRMDENGDLICWENGSKITYRQK